MVCMLPRSSTVFTRCNEGTGKSTVVSKLPSSLSTLLSVPVAAMKTPPTQLSSLRPIFDNTKEVDETMRRHFYQLGNYIVANKMSNTKGIVIIDRFWPSTIAYQEATKASHSMTELASKDSPIYFWPTDMWKPKQVITILLTVPEDVRWERISQREKLQSIKVTEEENQLKKK